MPRAEPLRCWRCPAYLNANLPVRVLSKDIEQFADQGFRDMPALWTRGLCPLADVGLPPPAPVQHLNVFPTTALDWTQMDTVEGDRFQFYLDESGGQYSSDPALRRAGWGVAVFYYRPRDPEEDLRPLCGVCGSLAGLRQTHERAALAGLIWLLQNVTGLLRVRVDAEYISGGDLMTKAFKGWRGFGANADL